MNRPAGQHLLNVRMQAIRGLIRSHLWAQILLAMALAVIGGLILSPETGGRFSLSIQTAATAGEWLSLPGQIFLNIIQMVVVALVSSSIILGISSSNDAAFLRKASIRIVPYFLSTSFLAVIIGVVIAHLIQPGQYIDSAVLNLPASGEGTELEIGRSGSPGDSLAKQISDLVPSNLMSATLSRNMLQIVVASLFAGVAFASMQREFVGPAIELLQIVQETAMKIVGWAMRLAPIAVFGLIIEFVMKVGFSALLGLSAYVATVVLGLLILLTVYLVIVTVFCRRSPFWFLAKVGDAQLLAFSTSSSAATMPLSLKIAEERLGVSPPVARFIIPLGATVNMDGTALYQVVAALFIAQLYGVHFSPTELTILIVTIVGASIGSPSTPGVGIVILASVLEGVGIPASGIAIVLGIDRLLDMCRTSVNVTGDLAACLVMNEWIDFKRTSD